MIPSRTFRVLFLASMFASMAVVLAWAGWIGWREWPEWRAVREMRAAVEANEPGRFLDAIEQVDSLGVAEAAADEIAPLRQHPDPRVRIYTLIARTVLRPYGPEGTRERRAICLDTDEKFEVRYAADYCEQVFELVPANGLVPVPYAPVRIKADWLLARCDNAQYFIVFRSQREPRVVGRHNDWLPGAPPHRHKRAAREAGVAIP